MYYFDVKSQNCAKWWTGYSFPHEHEISWLIHTDHHYITTTKAPAYDICQLDIRHPRHWDGRNRISYERSLYGFTWVIISFLRRKSLFICFPSSLSSCNSFCVTINQFLILAAGLHSACIIHNVCTHINQLLSLVLLCLYIHLFMTLAGPKLLSASPHMHIGHTLHLIQFHHLHWLHLSLPCCAVLCLPFWCNFTDPFCCHMHSRVRCICYTWSTSWKILFRSWSIVFGS